ncbi:MAG: TonB family protein [Elusimicrobia bacterium]|nr:TonB family protein [Elusimicrobiota bacterium]
MMSRHWDLVYGRPPVSLDAVLLGVAVALHLPLLLLQFQAPLRSAKSGSLYNIDVGEAFVKDILSRPAVLPRAIPDFIQAPPPISKLVPRLALPPVAIPPISGGPAGLKGLPATPPQIAGLGKTNLATGPVGTGSAPGAIPSIAGIPGGGKISLPGSVGEEPRGRIQNLNSRVQPISPNELEGIGGGVISAGNTPVVTIPEPSRPTLDLALLPEGHAKEGKISPGHVNYLESNPKSNPAILKGPGVGVVAPVVPRHGKEEPDSPSPVMEAHTFPTTAAGRKMEIFPIYGELKDRVVKYQELPEVPDAFKKKGEQNVVQFRFWVTRDGRVKENIELLKGSGSAGLDEIARTALLHWVFSSLPPEKGNLVQSGTIEFKFSFK